MLIPALACVSRSKLIGETTCIFYSKLDQEPQCFIFTMFALFPDSKSQITRSPSKKRASFNTGKGRERIRTSSDTDKHGNKSGEHGTKPKHSPSLGAGLPSKYCDCLGHLVLSSAVIPSSPSCTIPCYPFLSNLALFLSHSSHFLPSCYFITSISTVIIQ